MGCRLAHGTYTPATHHTRAWLVAWIAHPITKRLGGSLLGSPPFWFMETIAIVKTRSVGLKAPVVV